MKRPETRSPDENDPLDTSTPQTPPAGTGASGPLTVSGPLPDGSFRTETADTQPGPSLPFVLPGEHVLPGPPLKILHSSPDRVQPLCPHFGPCGGCQYQHAGYSAQLAFKREVLSNLITPALLPGQPLPAIQAHSAEPWHYRNRIRLRVGTTSSGDDVAFTLGYSHRASNTFLPIHTCPISAPPLLEAAQALVTLSGTDPNVARWLGSTAEIELFLAPAGTLQLTLLLHTAPGFPRDQHARSFAALAEALEEIVPTLAGATAELLRPARANSARPHASRRAANTFTPPTWGSPGLLYPVPLDNRTGSTGAQLWVSRGSFFQVNRHLLGKLVAIATSTVTCTSPAAGTAPSLAWDLFAGVGLFTRALLPHYNDVVAVESSPTATADLASARLPNVRIITATVLDFLRAAVLERDRPALVLLDPPRAGLGLEAASLLTRIRPHRIVYVSCDPTTLARDLRAMLSSGYNLAELHLVDMFPQTLHLEAVAVLTLA